MDGLIEALKRVFPEESDERDPSGAMELTAEAAMLHRRLTGAIREAERSLEATREAEAVAARPAHAWWKVWRG